MFWSRFEPSLFASTYLVFSLQMIPSSMALFSPAYARSLNPLSPSPPTSSARPTFRSDVQAPLALPVAPEVVELFEQAAAMPSTTSGTATARSHLDMHTLPCVVPGCDAGPRAGSPGIVGFRRWGRQTRGPSHGPHGTLGAGEGRGMSDDPILDDLRRRIADSPFHSGFGLSVVDAEKGSVRLGWIARSEPLAPP